MYSELFRIPLELAGVPIFGVGLLLAVWLVGGGLWMLVASRQKGSKTTEVLGLLPGLVIGAAAIVLLPRFFPDGLPVRGYGVMVLCGAVLGMGMAIHRGKQQQLHPDVLLGLAFAMFLCGIVGARLFYVIEYWESRFQFNDWPSTLLAILKFTEGGLVIYGALIGATVAFVGYVIRHRLPAFAMADLIAPSLMAGLALGRIGCLLNGCCYGGESTLPWALSFPRESLPYMEQLASGRLYGFQLAESETDEMPEIVAVDDNSQAARAGMKKGMKLSGIDGQSVASLDMAQALLISRPLTDNLHLQTDGGQEFVFSAELPPRSRPVHPTQIYSAINAALVSWMLWLYYPRRRRDGEVIALMLTVYPIARFLLEMIRVDESAVFGTGLSISQNISILVLTGALGLWVYLLRQPPQRATFASG